MSSQTGGWRAVRRQPVGVGDDVFRWAAVGGVG
jgi:hypothetical protein